MKLMKIKMQSDRDRWLTFIGIVGVFTFAGYFVLYPQTLFKPSEKLFDLGYNLGLAGGLMMLSLLLYPLRKRAKFMSKMGALSTWFRWHMVMGILGPLAIIFHSTYHVYIPYFHPIGSPNSAVAMLTMLIVSASGVFGRFFYTKIHHGLYGRLATVNELTAKLDGAEDMKSVFSFAPKVEKALADFRARIDPHAVQSRTGVVDFITVGLQTMMLSRSLPREIGKIMRARATRENFTSEEYASMERLIFEHREKIVSYLRAVRDAAQFRTYERMFSWWHIFHIPLVYLMFFSAFYHVYAVHIY